MLTADGLPMEGVTVTLQESIEGKDVVRRILGGFNEELLQMQRRLEDIKRLRSAELRPAKRARIRA